MKACAPDVSQEGRGPLRSIVLPACLVLGAIVAAVLLVLPPRKAAWVTVVAADAATAGAGWTATVTLEPPFTGNWLAVDLHGADGRGEWLGCVGTSEARPVGALAQTLRFTVPLRADPAIREVWAVVVLSTTGDWGTRTLVATSERIPVRADVAAATTRPLGMHDLVREPPAQDSASLRVRAVVAGLWLAAGALFWLRRRSDGGRWPVLLAVACLGIAAFELSGVGPRLLDTARDMAKRDGIYGQRRLMQSIASVVVLLGCAGFTALVLRRGRRVPALAVAGIGLYAAVALLGLLSLHEADRVLTARVLWLPVGKVLRAGAGLLALAGALGSRAGDAPLSPT